MDRRFLADQTSAGRSDWRWLPSDLLLCGEPQWHSRDLFWNPDARPGARFQVYFPILLIAPRFVASVEADYG